MVSNCIYLICLSINAAIFVRYASIHMSRLRPSCKLAGDPANLAVSIELTARSLRPWPPCQVRRVNLPRRNITLS